MNLKEAIERYNDSLEFIRTYITDNPLQIEEAKNHYIDRHNFFHPDSVLRGKFPWFYRIDGYSIVFHQVNGESDEYLYVDIVYLFDEEYKWKSHDELTKAWADRRSNEVQKMRDYQLALEAREFEDYKRLSEKFKDK